MWRGTHVSDCNIYYYLFFMWWSFLFIYDDCNFLLPRLSLNCCHTLNISKAATLTLFLASTEPSPSYPLVFTRQVKEQLDFCNRPHSSIYIWLSLMCLSSHHQAPPHPFHPPPPVFLLYDVKQSNKAKMIDALVLNVDFLAVHGR